MYFPSTPSVNGGTKFKKTKSPPKTVGRFCSHACSGVIIRRTGMLSSAKNAYLGSGVVNSLTGKTSSVNIVGWTNMVLGFKGRVFLGKPYLPGGSAVCTGYKAVE